MVEHAGGNAVEWIVEAAGEDDGLIGDAVAIGIGDAPDAPLGAGEVVGVELAGRDPLVDEGEPVLDGVELDVALHGVGDAELAGERTRVLHGVAGAVGLGDVEVALPVEADGDGVGDLTGLGPWCLDAGLGVGDGREREA